MNRVISQAETYGRLYSCGFSFIDEIFINNSLYFVFKKVKEPVFDYHPTYGALIRLKRYGKNGKVIKVYKFRTMHAYSEYLQNFIFEKNALQEGGKFRNDYRVNTIGKIMRKFWIDELPMLFNLFKGDLKLFGVRPLSQQYFDLYDADLKDKRLKYRPGLVPPFYVDLPKTFLPNLIKKTLDNLYYYFHSSLCLLLASSRVIVFSEPRRNSFSCSFTARE